MFMVAILTRLTISPPSDLVIVTVTVRRSQSSNRTGKYRDCSPPSRNRGKCPLQVNIYLDFVLSCKTAFLLVTTWDKQRDLSLFKRLINWTSPASFEYLTEARCLQLVSNRCRVHGNILILAWRNKAGINAICEMSLNSLLPC